VPITFEEEGIFVRASTCAFFPIAFPPVLTDFIECVPNLTRVELFDSGVPLDKTDHFVVLNYFSAVM
jgi:hypothetical protein